jgi:hypothetical protein
MVLRALVLLLLLAAVAAPAGAQQRAFSAPEPPIAMALDGDRVVWAADAGSATIVARAAGPSGPAGPVQLSSEVDDPEYPTSLTSFGAAAGRIAYTTSSHDRYDTVYENAFAGPFAGPYTPIPSGCGDMGVRPGSIALTAEVLVVAECAITSPTEAGRRVELRDPAEPGRAGTVVARDGADVRADGRYVAWREDGAIVVLDRRSGERVLRVAVPLPDEGGYDLGEDGTVVALAGPSPPAPLVVASPASPQPRPLGVTAHAVDLDGDQVVALDDRGFLRAIGRDGAQRVLLRPRTRGDSPLPFAAAGGRVAWTQAGCHAFAVRLAAREDLPVQRRALRCRVRIDTRRLVARPGRPLSAIRAACPLVRPSSCRALVTVRTRAGTVLASVRTPSLGSTPVTPRLTAAGRATIRRARRPLPVTISVSEPGRRAVLRRVTLTVRR